MSTGVIQEGTLVRLRSGTEGWIQAKVVEYTDLITSPSGAIYTGPAYKVHILEGKHKGETIRVPANYVELLGPGKAKRETLYPHEPKKKEPLFPHRPKGRSEPIFPHTSKGKEPWQLERIEKLSPLAVTKGTCYEDAWRFVIKEGEGYLIHGTVWSDDRRIGHAWVETETGYVWEPETKKFYTERGFMDVAAPVAEQSYTPEHAAIMAARTKNFGPWSEQERRQYLGESLPQKSKGPQFPHTTRAQSLPQTFTERVYIYKGHQIKEVEYQEEKLKGIKDWWVTTPEGKFEGVYTSERKAKEAIDHRQPQSLPQTKGKFEIRAPDSPGHGRHSWGIYFEGKLFEDVRSRREAERRVKELEEGLRKQHLPATKGKIEAFEDVLDTLAEKYKTSTTRIARILLDHNIRSVHDMPDQKRLDAIIQEGLRAQPQSLPQTLELLASTEGETSWHVGQNDHAP